MRLIDADELITQIESYIERKAITEKDAKIFELICDLINNAETIIPFASVETHDTVNMYCDKDTQIIVEQIRPKGHWICEDALRCLYYCSECRNNGEHIQPFCAWCGADMRKGGAVQICGKAVRNENNGRNQ